MRLTEDSRILRPPWRTAAVWLLAVAFVVATGALALDGGRPALAASDCEYGEYGPYGPYGPYGEYDEPCPTVQPTLALTVVETVEIGDPVSPLAALANGDDPTGTLTFRLYRPGDSACSDAIYEGVVTVTGNGGYVPPTFTDPVPSLDELGVWRFIAAYSGDARNEPAATECGEHEVTVVKATPTLSATAVPTLAARRETIGASVALSGGYLPSGAVAFRLFGPDDPACAGTPAYVEQVSLTGSEAATAVGFRVPKKSVGTWNWTASYLGDASNEAHASTCGAAPVRIVKKLETTK